ncbi:DNA alkylation repair protein [Leptospira sp. WS92.C1]
MSNPQSKKNVKRGKTNPHPSQKKKSGSPADLSAERFVKQLKTYRSAEELKKYHRYFQFDEKPSDKGDTFIGVRMGKVFDLAKEFIDMNPHEIEKLLESPVHEIRAGGCSIMGKQATHKTTSERRRRELYDLYLRRHDRINNWDLVDLASYKVIGSYLFNFKKPRKILYKLARSKDTWERRTSIVSTFSFIAKGEVDDTFRIAEILLKDDQDLVHKATGWALREAGKKDPQRLSNFLDKHVSKMPRTLLRYAIERLSPKQKTHYMSKEFKKGNPPK